jgi:beta-phosphoglucomutase-like phosphatase (HAD superfamily)
MQRIEAIILELAGCLAEFSPGVENARLYEDVVPALVELRAMGVRLIVTSPLSAVAIERFLEIHRLNKFFAAVWSRDDVNGVKAALAGVRPERAIYITQTAEGLNLAKGAEVRAVLMMNDPDEARKLALRSPAGGIVSLHELPDFVRLIAAQLTATQQLG